MKMKKFKNFQQMPDEMRNGERVNTRYICPWLLLRIILAAVFYVSGNNDLRKFLRKATAKRERLRERLSEKEKFQNIEKQIIHIRFF